jgi:hypothetical protein
MEYDLLPAPTLTTEKFTSILSSASSASKRLRQHKVVEWPRVAGVAGMRMLVQTDGHASCQSREVRTCDSGPYAVSGLP